MASGVLRKCRSEPAILGRRSRRSVVAYQVASIGVAGVSTTRRDSPGLLSLVFPSFLGVR
jgi:hypothetical protein